MNYLYGKDINPDNLPQNEKEFLSFIMFIKWLCLSYGCSVTSWVRTIDRNAKVGGNPQSRHISGRAVDIVPDAKKMESKILIQIKAHGYHYKVTANCIHIQIDAPQSVRP